MSSGDRIYESSQRLKRAFKEAEAAEYIAMSRSFLRQSRMNGKRSNRPSGPTPTYIGRTVRYLREDLDAWLDKFRVESDVPMD